MGSQKPDQRLPVPVRTPNARRVSFVVRGGHDWTGAGDGDVGIILDADADVDASDDPRCGLDAVGRLTSH